MVGVKPRSGKPTEPKIDLSAGSTTESDKDEIIFKSPPVSSPLEQKMKKMKLSEITGTGDDNNMFGSPAPPKSQSPPQILNIIMAGTGERGLTGVNFKYNEFMRQIRAKNEFLRSFSNPSQEMLNTGLYDKTTIDKIKGEISELEKAQREFYEDKKTINNHNFSYNNYYPDPKHQAHVVIVEGAGSRYGLNPLKSNNLDFITADSEPKKIEACLNLLRDAKKNSELPEHIVLNGFSRGGSACIELARAIYLEFGEVPKITININDPVPGPNRHTESKMVIPPNVDSLIITYAGHERNNILYQPQDLNEIFYDETKTTVTTLTFPMKHNGIFKDEFSSSIKAINSQMWESLTNDNAKVNPIQLPDNLNNVKGPRKKGDFVVATNTSNNPNLPKGLSGFHEGLRESAGITSVTAIRNQNPRTTPVTREEKERELARIYRDGQKAMREKKSFSALSSSIVQSQATHTAQVQAAPQAAAPLTERPTVKIDNERTTNMLPTNNIPIDLEQQRFAVNRLAALKTILNEGLTKLKKADNVDLKNENEKNDLAQALRDLQNQKYLEVVEIKYVKEGMHSPTVIDKNDIQMAIDYLEGKNKFTDPVSQFRVDTNARMILKALAVHINGLENIANNTQEKPDQKSMNQYLQTTAMQNPTVDAPVVRSFQEYKHGQIVGDPIHKTENDLDLKDIRVLISRGKMGLPRNDAAIISRYFDKHPDQLKEIDKKNGNTILHLLAQKANEANKPENAKKCYGDYSNLMLDFISHNGADPTIKNGKDKSPIDIAVEGNNQEVLNKIDDGIKTYKHNKLNKQLDQTKDINTRDKLLEKQVAWESSLNKGRLQVQENLNAQNVINARVEAVVPRQMAPLPIPDAKQPIVDRSSESSEEPPIVFRQTEQNRKPVASKPPEVENFSSPKISLESLNKKSLGPEERMNVDKLYKLYEGTSSSDTLNRMSSSKDLIGLYQAYLRADYSKSENDLSALNRKIYQIAVNRPGLITEPDKIMNSIAQVAEKILFEYDKQKDNDYNAVYADLEKTLNLLNTNYKNRSGYLFNKKYQTINTSLTAASAAMQLHGNDDNKAKCVHDTMKILQDLYAHPNVKNFYEIRDNTFIQQYTRLEKKCEALQIDLTSTVPPAPQLAEPEKPVVKPLVEKPAENVRQGASGSLPLQDAITAKPRNEDKPLEELASQLPAKPVEATPVTQNEEKPVAVKTNAEKMRHWREERAAQPNASRVHPVNLDATHDVKRPQDPQASAQLNNMHLSASLEHPWERVNLVVDLAIKECEKLKASKDVNVAELAKEKQASLLGIKKLPIEVQKQKMGEGIQLAREVLEMKKAKELNDFIDAAIEKCNTLEKSNDRTVAAAAEIKKSTLEVIKHVPLDHDIKTKQANKLNSEVDTLALRLQERESLRRK